MKRINQLSSKKYGVSCVYGMPLSSILEQLCIRYIEVIQNLDSTFVVKNQIHKLHMSVIRCKGQSNDMFDKELICMFYEELFKNFSSFQIIDYHIGIGEDGAVRLFLETDFSIDSMQHRLQVLQNKYGLNGFRMTSEFWINIGETNQVFNENGINHKVKSEMKKKFSVTVNELKVVYFEDIAFHNSEIIKSIILH